MAETATTRDPDEIEDWVVNHGGLPAREPGSFAELRIDFGDLDEVEHLTWDEFFEILETENLVMEYELASNSRHPRQKYDFVQRDLGEALAETEMDDEEVLANTEETS